ncbi:unnamed protein product [Sympodiomycopsis kandeliae]
MSTSHRPPIPTRLAGSLPSRLSTPLSFPIGSFLGFLLGFSTASIGGYFLLLREHQSIHSQSVSTLNELKHTVEEVKSSSDVVFNQDSLFTGLTSRVDQLENRLEGLDKVNSKSGIEVGRLERRVKGVEEEMLELKEAVLELNQHFNTPSSTSSLASLREELKRIGIQNDTRSTTLRRSGQLEGGLLWTGRSEGSRRLV